MSTFIINNAHPQFVESKFLDYGFYVKIFISNKKIVSILYSPYDGILDWDIVEADEFRLPVVNENSIYCDGEYCFSCMPPDKAKELMLMSGYELPFIELNPITKQAPIGLCW